MDNPTVFISHSSLNSKCAEEICSYLESHEVKCWIAPRDIRPGTAYPSEITRGIKESSIFLVILTNESADSRHVTTETDIAFNNNKIIIPFFIDKVELGDSMSYYLARKQWILGYDNYAHAIENLLQCIHETNTNCKEVDSNIDNRDCSFIESPLKNENRNIGINIKNLRCYTKPQLYFLGIITILFLVLFPLLGIFLGIIILLYPKKIQYFLHKNKAKIVLAISTLICAILGWCAFLWYDEYKSKKRIYNADQQDVVAESIQSDDTLSIIKSPDYLENTTVDDGIINQSEIYSIPANQELNLETRTSIDNKVCDATWKIKNRGGSPYFNGHIKSHLDTLNDLICKLSLYKKSLEGVIEDIDGANIGYFEGKIHCVSYGYQIRGELVVENGDDSYKQLKCIIDIHSDKNINEIIDQEMLQNND